MKKLGKYYRYQSFHFLGINGVSMQGLAKFCAINGKNVTGSDLVEPKNPERLKNLKIEFFKGHDKANVKNADLVIYTSAVNEKNVELVQAKKKKIPVIKRSKLLGDVISEHAYSIGVSGSHGKTTATAMIAEILIGAKKSPTVFLGGESPDYGNFRLGSGEYVVAEACEFQKNLLDISTKISVILNLDNDHMDSYKDMEDMVETFNKFIGQNVAVINADDPNSKGVGNLSTVTFGIEKKANYYATGIRNEGGKYSFNACAYNHVHGRIKLSVLGLHNVYNALSAFAVGDLLNIPFEIIKQALERFRGVKRRQEFLGERNGVEYFADYAHHPREIGATLSCFNQLEKIAVIFQPHTYSRTEILMEEFICVLEDVEDLAIYKTYPAREQFKEEGDGKTLYERLIKRRESLGRGKKTTYLENEKELLEFLLGENNFNKVLFLGAGDVYEHAKSVIKGL